MITVRTGRECHHLSAEGVQGRTNLTSAPHTAPVDEVFDRGIVAVYGHRRGRHAEDQKGSYT